MGSDWDQYQLEHIFLSGQYTADMHTLQNGGSMKTSLILGTANQTTGDTPGSLPLPERQGVPVDPDGAATPCVCVCVVQGGG